MELETANALAKYHSRRRGRGGKAECARDALNG